MSYSGAKGPLAPDNRLAGEMNVMMLAVVLAGLSFDVAAANVFKCLVDGKVVYADAPCGDNAKSIAVPATAGSDGAAADATEPYELQREAGMGRVVVGQTASQVRQAWGDPMSVNVETDASGRMEQWLYERNGATSIVYIRGGKVTSLSTGPGGGDNTTPVESAPKPTEEGDRGAGARGQSRWPAHDSKTLGEDASIGRHRRAGQQTVHWQ